MKKLLQEIYQNNINVLREYKYRNEINKKTGLSINEKKNINNNFTYIKGTANFFGNPFHFSNGVSFLHSIAEIFADNIYNFSSNIEDPYIIDCGANIGLSIYYFKKLYPKSTILGFEPDNEIFEILKDNIKFFPNNDNIEIRKEAVWIEDTTLDFFSEGGLAGSFSVDFSGRNCTYKTTAIDFKKYLDKKIDFLKIDIEGAENELIFDIKDKLDNVDRMFLEYHGISNKPQNLGDILNLLSESGFQYYIRLAGDTMKYPFCNEGPIPFNQQLNIFCFRI